MKLTARAQGPSFENAGRILARIVGVSQLETARGTVARWELLCKDRRGTELAGVHLATGTDAAKGSRLAALLLALGVALPDPIKGLDTKELIGRHLIVRVMASSDETAGATFYTADNPAATAQGDFYQEAWLPWLAGEPKGAVR